MAQHVAKFCHFLDEATRTIDGQVDPEASNRLAAKFVGRWHNGARWPSRPRSMIRP